MAAKALAQLLERTERPYRLVIVDSGYPDVFRKQVEEVTRPHDWIEWFETKEPVSSNEARNRFLASCTDDPVCLIENDVFVEEGWLAHLVNALKEAGADVAVPMLLEPDVDGNRVHFDERMGSIHRRPDGRIEILHRTTLKEADRTSNRHRVDFIEMHCIMFRLGILDRIGPFHPEHSSRAEVDLSLALHDAQATVVMEPGSQVLFSPPPPVYPEERDYYLAYWDLETQTRMHRLIEQRWNVVHCPSALGFVRARLRIPDEPDPDTQVRTRTEYLEQRRQLEADVAAVVPEGSTCILVDSGQLKPNEVAPHCKVLPFLERDGVAWGNPEDDEEAIRELDRMRQAGASYLLLVWPAFWWRQHYRGFVEHLHSHHETLVENERLAAFRLQEA